jgi:hypothetical protein
VSEAGIPGERRPLGLWLALAAIGAVAAVASTSLAVRAGSDAPPPTIESSAASTGPVPSDPRAESSDPSVVEDDPRAESSDPSVVDSTNPQVGPPSVAGDGADGADVDRSGEAVAGPSVELDCPPELGIRFSLGGAEPVGPVPETDIAALVGWAERHGEAELIVGGHADASGSEERNLALSFDRAEVVVGLLIDGGLAAERLHPRGYGEYQVMVGEPPDSDRNRRVTVQATGFEVCEMAPADNAGGDR